MQVGGSQQLVLATILAPVLWSGVQGQAPNVASGVGRIQTIQEQPAPGAGALNRGVQGPNVASGIGSVRTTQEQPSPGSSVVGAGIQGPNVASGIGRILAPQEQPPPGSSVVATGIQGPNVASGIGRILSVQEQPRLGEGIGFNRGIQISVQPNVAFGVGSILTQQEQPRAGDAILGRGVQGPNVATGIGAIFAWQEQPPQAPSFVSLMRPFVVTVTMPPGTRSVLLQQEIPWHPQAPFTFIPSKFTSSVVVTKAEWIVRYRRRGRR